MRTFLINYLVNRGQRTYPGWYRFVVLIGTIIFVFIFLPAVFIFTGRFIEFFVTGRAPAFMGALFALVCLGIGTTLIIWTLLLHYGYARGSGSHMAPPRELILSGPYRICRHPMQVGAILLYLGTGIWFASVFVGVYGALVTLLLGYWFHTYIEEPVLVIRFGDAYRRYQKTVPLVPFLFVGAYKRNGEHKAGD